MQTFLKVFQTGSIPRRTPDQVRYHYIVKTDFIQNACSTHLHSLHLFDALQHCRVHAIELVPVAFLVNTVYKLFSFLVL